MNAANDGDNYYSLEEAPAMDAPAAPAMDAPAAPAMDAPAAPAMDAPMGMDQGMMGMELAPMEQPVEEEEEEEEEDEEASKPIENVADVIKTINPYSTRQIALAFATLIGAFGGFPEPPRQFTELARNEWFRWLMIAVLVFQGAGGQDPRLAAVVTLLDMPPINF